MVRMGFTPAHREVNHMGTAQKQEREVRGDDVSDRIRGTTMEEGFTLFELLIVIIILAILAGIVAYSVGSSRAGAVTSSCQSDAKGFATALEEYKADVGQYPVFGTGALGYDDTATTGLTQPFTYDGSTVGPFLRELPATAHYQIFTDGAGGVFVYPAAPAPHDPTSSSMEGDHASTYGDPSSPSPSNSLNFETDPGICNNTYIVS